MKQLRMKGLFMTFIIHVILVDTMLSLSESESCNGEHCGSVISMPLIDNMKATLKADLDVSKMNKHLKAYIEQEIEIGVKKAVENLMKQMIKNKTETMNAEITAKFIDAEDRQISKTDQMEQLIKNKTEKMTTEIMTMSLKTNKELTVRFENAEERQTRKTDQMEQLIKNKSEEMLTLFKDNNDKTKASFDVKMEEFKQKFELKDKFKYVFFSFLSSSQADSNVDTTVVFDVAPLNIGNAYDGTTGKFTCKEDGIYTFSWTTLSYGYYGFTSVLVVDGTPIASNVVDNIDTEDAMTGSITVIVKMTKGQEAWIKVAETDNNYLTSSVFSGFKI